MSAAQGETADVTMVGTIAVPADDTIDPAAIAAWMEAHVPGAQGPVRLAKFKGGQSNPTYRVDTATKSYVLRRQPFGKLLPSAHAVYR